MCSVFADNRTFFSGSKMTMSASEPGAIVPFRGKRPKIFAGDVDVSSTNRFREIPTGSHAAVIDQAHARLDPRRPVRDLREVALPIVFCSFMQKGQ
jgi:hypothetical protein